MLLLSHTHQEVGRLAKGVQGSHHQIVHMMTHQAQDTVLVAGSYIGCGEAPRYPVTLKQNV